MAGRSPELDEGYLSAHSGGGPSCSSPTLSSVPSEDLEQLLVELQIVPARIQQGKRPFEDSDEASSPSSSRPQASPRLEVSPSRTRRAGSERAAGAGTAAATAALARRRQQQPAATATAGPEIIDLLSSDSGSEDGWQIAAPASTRNRFIVDSEGEDDGDSEEEADLGVLQRPDSRASVSALPPFLAAIPALSAAGLGGAHAKQHDVQLQQQWQQRQQHTAAPQRSQAQSSHQQVLPLQRAAAPTGSARGKCSGGLSMAAFKKQRGQLAAELFQEFNRTIFEGRLPADLEISWNARLLTTAGLTHYRRDIPDDPYAPPIYSARVELSGKVLDSYAKLERTLCHELCHVAAWLLDHTAKPPHGPVFKRWAARGMARYTHLDITACHAYEIFYPFKWQCSSAECLQEYGRHSNSIDVSKKVCGRCRAPLTFLGRFKPDSTPVKPRSAAASQFTGFVKENYAEARRQLPAGTPQKDVMRHLSARYQEQKRTQQDAAGAGGGTATAADGSTASAATLA